MTAKTRLSDKALVSSLDEVVGIRDDGTGPSVRRIKVENLAAQLSVGGGLAKATWAALSEITGSTNGLGARVIGDAGTHTDPVVGGTVDNEGHYGWYTSPAGWRWLGPLDFEALSDALDAEEAARIAADDLKANIASPTFTGTPAAPTATSGTNTTQIATTAFVTTAVAAEASARATADNLKAPIANPTFTGTPAAPTAASGTDTTQIATTAFVTAAVADEAVAREAADDLLEQAVSDEETARIAADALKAPLASPALTGSPTAPTAAGGTNTTQIATTAFVTTAVAGEATARASAVTAEEAARIAADDLKANIASPTFTGTPAAPTAAGGTNTTQIATTAFVTTAVAAEASARATAVSDESAARAAADDILEQAIEDEETARLAADALKAPLASPALTGVPTAPTASAGASTTQIATTAFVTTAVTAEATARSTAVSNEATARFAADTALDAALTAEAAARVAADNLKAPLASPTLTGTPLAPTASAGTNTTQIATTSFVTTAVAGEATARATAVSDEATARAAADTVLDDKYARLETSRHSGVYMPGLAPALFTSGTYGAPQSTTALTTAGITDTAYGKAYRVTGSALVNSRNVAWLSGDRSYRCRVVYRRAVDSPDPNNDAIETIVYWLTNTFQLVSEQVVYLDQTLVVSSGLKIYSFDLPEKPSGAVYARLGLRMFGADSNTDIYEVSYEDTSLIENPSTAPTSFKGTWDADANNPLIEDGVGTTGDFYIVSVSGDTDIDGALGEADAWNVGDQIMFNGTVWVRIPIGYAARTENTIRAYGAVIDGVTADNAAVVAMAAAVGYVVFPPGPCKLTTITIGAPAYFEPGAYVTGASGQTITFNRRVQSPAQHIFRGDATYSLGHDATGGEDAREVHISWFGAFPYSGTSATDHGAIIEKAATAMGNSRESIIHFDIGNYTIASEVTLTRGCWIKGDGTRRTVFRCATDGFAAFVTNGNAVKWSDIQFESWAETPREYPWINVAHTDCEIYNVDMGDSALGIVTTGENTRIFNVRAIYGEDMGAGSSLIEVRGGGQVRIDGIMIGTSGTYAPEALVRVGGADQSSTISAVSISNITARCPAQTVMFEAFGGNISRCTVSGLRYNSSAVTVPDNILTFATSSTYSMNDITVNDVVEAHSANGIRFEQNSSGTMQDIFLDNVSISGSTGHGIEFVRTDGELREIRIGNNVDVTERATPFYYSGTNINDILVAPLAQPNALPAMCYDLGDIADDGFAQREFNRQIFSSIVMISTNQQESGVFMCRIANDTRWMTPLMATAGIETSTATLDGTTGTDGKITVSAADGKIMVENRTGSARRAQVYFLCGIQ
jgi:hypothetical protein